MPLALRGPQLREAYIFEKKILKTLFSWSSTAEGSHTRVGGREYGKKISWSSSGRSLGEYSGPFCLKTSVYFSKSFALMFVWTLPIGAYWMYTEGVMQHLSWQGSYKEILKDMLLRRVLRRRLQRISVGTVLGGGV